MSNHLKNDTQLPDTDFHLGRRQYLKGLAVVGMAATGLLGVGAVPARATVESLTIDNPASPTNFGSAPVNVNVTFTWSESHVLGDYRSIITIGPGASPVVQETFLYQPGDEIRNISSSGIETYTMTHQVTVPAGTPAGSYDLTVKVEEEWPPGSGSWGFGQQRTVTGAIMIIEAGLACNGLNVKYDLDNPAHVTWNGNVGAAGDFTFEVLAGDASDPKEIRVTHSYHDGAVEYSRKSSTHTSDFTVINSGDVITGQPGRKAGQIHGIGSITFRCA